MTPRCNLKCRMCYVRLTPEQMAPIGRERTAAEWIHLAAQARDAGMTFLLITGGEPTLRQDFAEIYEALAGMGLSISINTNGTLLPPALRELWHRLPPAQVNVTLYGTCREDYDALCGNPDAFDAVIDTLDWLQEEGILLHLNSTIIPANYAHWLQIEDFAKARGLDLRMTTYCFPPIRRKTDCCAGCDFSRLSPEDAAELSIQDLLYREGYDAVVKRAASQDAPARNGCSLDVGDPMQCMAGKSQFWVTWDGRMSPCGMLDQPAVRPFEDGFAKAWSTLHQATDQIRLCPDCLSCPDRNDCFNCAAVVYTETGRFEGKPEYMCQMTRAYREKLHQLVHSPDSLQDLQTNTNEKTDA